MKTVRCVKESGDAYSKALEDVPDWFAMPRMLEIANNTVFDKLITWCNRNKPHNACRKLINKELMLLVNIRVIFLGSGSGCEYKKLIYVFLYFLAIKMCTGIDFLKAV